jgi:hypothetical protein
MNSMSSAWATMTRTVLARLIIGLSPFAHGFYHRAPPRILVPPLSGRRPHVSSAV